MKEEEDREPTADEREGMEWFNSLSDEGRYYWLTRAGTSVPAEAWRMYKYVKNSN